MALVNFIQAINQAIDEEMERDPLTFVMGEDVILAAVRRDPRTDQEIRPQARAQHANFGGRLRRRGGGRGDGRDAADLRSRVRELLLLRVRPGV